MPTVFIFDHATQKSVDQSARKLEQDVQASITDLAYEIESDITSVQSSVAEVELELDTCVKREQTISGESVILNSEGSGKLYADILFRDTLFSRLYKDYIAGPRIFNKTDIENEAHTYIDSIRTRSSNSIDTLTISNSTGFNELGIDLSDNTYSELKHNSIPLFRINSDNNTVRAVGSGGLATNRLVAHSGSTINIESNVNIKGLDINLNNSAYSELSYNLTPLFRINSDNNTVRAVGSGGLATNRLVPHSGSSIDIDSNVNINGTLSHKHSTFISDAEGIVVSKAYSIYIRRSGNSNETVYTLPTSGPAYDDLRGSTIMIKNCINVDVPTLVYAADNKLDGGVIGTIRLLDLSSVTLYCSNQDEYWYILSSHGLINFS